MTVRNTSIAVILSALISVPALALLLGYRFATGARGLAAGDDLPQAELTTPDGRRVNTGSWRGKGTVLVLFQPACKACQFEIRALREIAVDFPHVRFVLLSLDGVNPGPGVPFEMLQDPSGEFIRRMRRMVVPTVYWIDPEGRILHSRAGLRPAAEDRVLCNRFFSAGNP